MTTSIPEIPLSRRKRFLFSLIACFFFSIAFLSLAEVTLRVKGFRPWSQSYVKMEPPGNYHVPAPAVGYLPRPGETRFTLSGPYSFKITTLSNGLRITHPLNTYSEKLRKEIWIFGCSFTQGWSVNDDQTYPWLLQEQLPKYEVVNFGVDAYSTVQSLLLLRQSLEKRQKPVVVVLSYSSFHDIRNTLTRSWMKQRNPGNPEYIPGSISLPYARLAADNKLEYLYMPLEYSGVPLLRYLALSNYLDEKYNIWLESSYHSHEVSRAVIEDFTSLCKANGITVVVAGIYPTPETSEMLDYLNRKGVMTVDISVDWRIKENTNLPYDVHPSAIAHQHYAQALKSFLCSKLTNELGCTGP
jgi:hypothetical protein